MAIQIKRIYEPSQPSDGIRILADRLWPRGVSKENANIDAWVKELTPSPELRTWFGHKAENFNMFEKLYVAELETNPEAHRAAEHIITKSKDETVTLLYAAKDPHINHAVILKTWLEGKA